MTEPILFIDTWLANHAMPALWRIVLWALLSGIIAMIIYACIAPQEKIRALKTQQKKMRDELLLFRGNWEEGNALIRQNVKLALRMIALCLLPVIAAAIPVLWVMESLHAQFGDQAILMIGPQWLHGFEALYIVILLVVSMAIKLLFEIA